MILRILGTFALDLLMALLAFIAVPIALIGLSPEAKHLPSWARWFETYDYDINGDAPWQGPEHANGNQNTYYWRLRWLLRNRTGVFAYEVLGFDRGDVISYTAQGDVYTGNIPGHSGWLYAEALTASGKTYPCYYIVYQWGQSQYCLRFYAGWKFRQAKQLRYWPKEGLAQFVVHFNPLQHFEAAP